MFTYKKENELVAPSPKMSHLTFKEEELWKRFQAWLNLENKKVFSSDDFRRYGLHSLMRDPKHDLGALFAKKVRNREITQVSWIPSTIPSNHGRMIRLYENTE